LISNVLVSVVLAVHNGAATLDAAIRSVLAQTLQAFELVVIDDSSSDESGSIIARHARIDSRVISLRYDHKLGLARALNIGWRRARTDLIARMDADDVCLPTRLERQVSEMTAHPEIAVLGTGAVLIDDEGREVGIARRPADHDTLVREIYRENPFMHPTVIMRRAFLEAMSGYDEHLRRAQDIDLWLRGRRTFRYANLEEPLIKYHVGVRPKFAAIGWGTFVLARDAWREGRFLKDSKYAARYFAATMLGKLGLHDARPR
jgi:glycosyltransferase involved in cell wall biosynthesis